MSCKNISYIHGFRAENRTAGCDKETFLVMIGDVLGNLNFCGCDRSVLVVIGVNLSLIHI